MEKHSLLKQWHFPRPPCRRGRSSDRGGRQGGKKSSGKLAETAGFSQRRLQEARTVLKYSIDGDLADGVLSGALKLDKTYEVAKARKTHHGAAQATAPRGGGKSRGASARAGARGMRRRIVSNWAPGPTPPPGAGTLQQRCGAARFRHPHTMAAGVDFQLGIVV